MLGIWDTIIIGNKSPGHRVLYQFFIHVICLRVFFITVIYRQDLQKRPHDLDGVSTGAYPKKKIQKKKTILVVASS